MYSRDIAPVPEHMVVAGSDHNPVVVDSQVAGGNLAVRGNLVAGGKLVVALDILVEGDMLDQMGRFLL